MKYRAIYLIKCDCGAKYGQNIHHFESDNDNTAFEIAKKFGQDRSPERGHTGLRHLLSELKRIDQEEKSIDVLEIKNMEQRICSGLNKD